MNSRRAASISGRCFSDLAPAAQDYSSRINGDLWNAECAVAGESQATSPFSIPILSSCWRGRQLVPACPTHHHQAPPFLLVPHSTPRSGRPFVRMHVSPPVLLISLCQPASLSRARSILPFCEPFSPSSRPGFCLSIIEIAFHQQKTSRLASSTFESVFRVCRQLLLIRRCGISRAQVVYPAKVLPPTSIWCDGPTQPLTTAIEFLESPRFRIAARVNYRPSSTRVNGRGCRRRESGSLWSRSFKLKGSRSQP